MNLDKDPSSWARINPAMVANWHPTEVQNFVAMALGDIAKLAAEVERLQEIKKAARRWWRARHHENSETQELQAELLSKAVNDYVS